MLQPLLVSALHQAESSNLAVRAAALMHIARVWATDDQTVAEQILERGIELARQLDSKSKQSLLGNAIYLAAAVSAAQALPLYASQRRAEDPFGSQVIGLVNAMAQHGHVLDAIDYLNDPLPGDPLPLTFINNLATECPDDQTRLKLLRVGILNWKRDSSPIPGLRNRGVLTFAGFFGRYWKLLPPEEAMSVLRELVQFAVDMKSEPRRLQITADG